MRNSLLEVEVLKKVALLSSVSPLEATDHE